MMPSPGVGRTLVLAAAVAVTVSLAAPASAVDSTSSTVMARGMPGEVSAPRGVAERVGRLPLHFEANLGRASRSP